MLKDLFKEYILPGAVFGGGMIGVGFLSLPYILTKVGLWTMLFYFIFITGIVVLINFIFCEISLKTPDFKRFPGFVGYYLGKWPKAFSLLSLVAGSIGVLLVYLLVAEKFLGSLNYVLIYFLIASIII